MQEHIKRQKEKFEASQRASNANVEVPANSSAEEPAGSSLLDEERKEPEVRAAIPQQVSCLMDDDNSASIPQSDVVNVYQGKLQGLSYVPQPYKEELVDPRLDIANLEKPDEQANFFVCPVCASVVKEAVECGSCSTLFCKSCIEPWTQNNDHCPKKCRGNDAVEFKDINRFVKECLNKLRFKCANQGCTSVNGYEAAMKHIHSCEMVMQPCVLGCGLGILGKDMQFHIENQCENAGEECKICGEMVFKNRQGEHDCVASLKEQLKKVRAENEILKSNYAPVSSVLPEEEVSYSQPNIYEDEDEESDQEVQYSMPDVEEYSRSLNRPNIAARDLSARQIAQEEIRALGLSNEVLEQIGGLEEVLNQLNI